MSLGRVGRSRLGLPPATNFLRGLAGQEDFFSSLNAHSQVAQCRKSFNLRLGLELMFFLLMAALINVSAVSSLFSVEKFCSSH